MQDWRLFEWLCVVQGAYFLLTGIWPLVSIGTFQRVTGPKTDLWLVKTVGVLIVAIGAALLIAGVQQQIDLKTVVLAASSAAGLTAIDVIYVAKRRIAPIYLLDAAFEILLLIGWGIIVREHWM